MVSGSVAVIVYGEPRLTNDVDLGASFNLEQLKAQLEKRMAAQQSQ